MRLLSFDPLHVKSHPLNPFIHICATVFLQSSILSPFPSILPFLPTLGPKLRCSICIYHQPIVIVNYNYYKRLHEIIINSDKMSEKKKNHNPHGCILLCDDNAIVSQRRCLRMVTMCFTIHNGQKS